MTRPIATLGTRAARHYLNMEINPPHRTLERGTQNG
jgi:hypothetical protein